MCHKIKTIAKNCHGDLSVCTSCSVYHLTFGNIYIELTPPEFVSFRAYINGVDIDYWECKYERMPIKRKIVVSTMQQNLSLMFNRSELASLKNLLSCKTKKPEESLSVLDIDYTLFLN